MEQREFEAVLSRLKKIKELADRGIDGEAEAATAKLRRGLERLGFTLADLQSIERTEQQIGKKSCDVSCDPSDYCEGGKCDRHGCYKP